jgi:protocatechuate 3,4-dioxygenase beta subunit
MTETQHELTRRRSLVAIGGFVALLAGAKGLAAGPAAGATRKQGAACVLTPELTEGPYYIANEALRRDITEGKPGARLTLKLRVVEATGCKPIRNAAVDIWHADAGGTYSGFGAGAGNRTFLRGIQKTDANGLATFTSIYPGWYPGRTVHIHVKVHVGGNVVHTGQLFFDDTLTDAVYRLAPYNSRPNRDTRNAADGIYQNGGSASLLAVKKTGSRAYTGSIAMGVRA